jgi:hypothetical protein
MRQKLAALGLHLDSNDTRQANLQLLIDRLSADLMNYQAEADSWQRKYLELKNTMESDIASQSYSDVQESPAQYSSSSTGPSDPLLADRTPNSDSTSSVLPIGEEFELIDFTQPSTNAASLPAPYDYSANFEYELVGRLRATANPTLSLVSITSLPFQSSVNHLDHSLHFEAVLDAFSSLMKFTLGNTPEASRWANISLIKPDFSERKARAIWNDVFAPIRVNPSHLAFDSAPSCRLAVFSDPDDPDMDHMDRILAKLSDFEVVDFFQNCSLLMQGIDRLAMDNKSLIPLRDHLGRNRQRLIREVIFTRNLSTNPKLAKSIFESLIANLGLFIEQDMESASITILELAWQLCVQHHSLVHPIAKAFLIDRSLIMASSPSTRHTWKRRSDQNLKDIDQNRFYSRATSLFTSSYFALFSQNEPELLDYLSKLDALLAPASDSHSTEGQVALEDPDIHICSLDDVTEDPSPTDLWVPKMTHGSHNSSIQATRVTTSVAGSGLKWGPGLYSNTNACCISESKHEQQSSIASHGITWDLIEAYKPTEIHKLGLRVMVSLIRAEASLVWSNPAACTHWVDDAESMWLLLPRALHFQRGIASVMRNVFRHMCSFPSGKRTVAQEFERRMMHHEACMDSIRPRPC